MPAFFSPALSGPALRATASRSILSRLQRRGPCHDSTHQDHGLALGFDWPADPTIEAIGEAVSAATGLRVVVKPIPDELHHHELSDLTTVTGKTAHVFYDEQLSPLNREQTILHEFAHILHGDVRADSDCTRTHLRGMFDNPIEKRAETTGMRLLDMTHRSRSSAEGSSEVLAFISGVDDGLRR